MLRLENITAGYGKIPVIKDINIEFEKGRITTIIGPNGSGKSTLLKAIVDLCEIQQGTVCLKGKSREIIGQKEFAKQVSYLPQIHTAGAITVGRMVLHGRFPYLSYPRHYRREDHEYCIKAMERTGILSLKDKKVEELSGGQRQKVYLAMALAGETEIFLFDEPTTYLDISYQLELLQIMKQLKEQGKTIITVLHDLDFALRISDAILVMKQGIIAKTGTPEEVLKSGIIDEIFDIKVKSFIDNEGMKHFYYEEKD
jgi:iron complex transport system ATP-binding protein